MLAGPRSSSYSRVAQSSYYPTARRRDLAREKSPNSPRVLPLLPGAACPAAASKVCPRCRRLYFPLPVLAGSRQEPGWGCSSAPRRAGICRQPGGLASCPGQTAFPSRRRTGGLWPPGPGLGHSHALGKGLSPSPAFWAPSELVLGRRKLPTNAAAMSISVARVFIVCLQTSHFPALEYIVVVGLTKNTGVPVQGRLAAYAGRCRELGQGEKAGAEGGRVQRGLPTFAILL